MSGVYWHFEDGSRVRMMGAERIYAACLCTDLAVSALGLSGELPLQRRRPGDPMLAYLGALLPSEPDLDVVMVRNALMGMGMERGLFLGKYDGLDVALNTALAAGSPATALLARLHGQCEIHAWVAEADRRWLASLIGGALAQGLYRREIRGEAVGWEAAAGALWAVRDRPGPVVLSYSVCRAFPSWALPNPEWETRAQSGTEAEREAASAAIEAWWELPYAERWAQGMAALYAAHEAHPGASLRLNPANWETYRFGKGKNAFQVAAEARAGVC